MSLNDSSVSLLEHVEVRLITHLLFPRFRISDMVVSHLEHPEYLLRAIDRPMNTDDFPS